LRTEINLGARPWLEVEDEAVGVPLQLRRGDGVEELDSDVLQQGSGVVVAFLLLSSSPLSSLLLFSPFSVLCKLQCVCGRERERGLVWV
jgi:hypothetical protein